MDRLILTAILLLTPIAVISAQEPVPEMKEIPAGYYWMGSSGWGHDYDEAPVHKVSISSFRMSVTEITNAQYELFRPEHRSLRGLDGFLPEDNAYEYSSPSLRIRYLKGRKAIGTVVFVSTCMYSTGIVTTVPS